MDDLRRTEALLVVPGRVLVIVDQVGTVRISFGRDVLARQYPDLLGNAQGPDIQKPIGAAMNLLVGGGQLPEVESVVSRIGVRQEGQERVIQHLFDAPRLGDPRRQVFGAATDAPSCGRALGEASGFGLAFLRRHVEPRLEAGSKRMH